MKRIIYAAVLFFPIVALARDSVDAMIESKQAKEITDLIQAKNGGNFEKLVQVLADKKRKVTSEHLSLSQKQVKDTQERLKKISKRDVAHLGFGILAGVTGVCALLTGYNCYKSSESRGLWLCAALSVPAWYAAVTSICKAAKSRSRTNDYKNACAVQALLKARA